MNPRSLATSATMYVPVFAPVKILNGVAPHPHPLPEVPGRGFPFIVGFPGESDASVRASLDVAKRLGAMSPKFETPVFYFRPYPGTQITTEAVRNGFALPCSLEDWATFDYVGSIGPWVSAAKYRLVERFKFYQRLACAPARLWKQLWQRLARWRLDHDCYALPLEKTVSEWLFPRPRLS
ncbi:MAG: hypothetical protein NTY19_20730 [Planctomycetota bacterium]|nr:hypothetical protein [Planctomycetota bacterium]